MENTASSVSEKMQAWMTSGGASVIVADDVRDHSDQGLESSGPTLNMCFGGIRPDMEMQAALLTRSPQTCYSIGQDIEAAAHTHRIECRI